MLSQIKAVVATVVYYVLNKAAVPLPIVSPLCGRCKNTFVRASLEEEKLVVYKKHKTPCSKKCLIRSKKLIVSLKNAGSCFDQEDSFYFSVNHFSTAYVYLHVIASVTKFGHFGKILKVVWGFTYLMLGIKILTRLWHFFAILQIFIIANGQFLNK